ncbi:MAG TPA: DUF4124 domain-containing protein [Gammaproteobacteria bacterium]|nr:DUF4124 domain-containing protein [Gammaproteobacteria bacterium]
MRLLLILAAAVLAASPLHAQKKSAQKLYRWVDDQGVVHFGDQIPPEYANRDREVLNSQGVAVKSEKREVSEAEKEEQRKREEAAEAERQAKEEAERRDRMLLATYLSVKDIEELRDRRLELLDSRIKVTEIYVGNLQKRLDKLQGEAKALENAANPRPVPADLAKEIADTQATIDSYEQSLERDRLEQTKVRESFDADIERFKELKGAG